MTRTSYQQWGWALPIPRVGILLLGIRPPSFKPDYDLIFLVTIIARLERGKEMYNRLTANQRVNVNALKNLLTKMGHHRTNNAKP